VETGCLPNLYPGGRPVVDASARVDLGAAWGVERLPEDEGLSADGILAALVDGDLEALVVGGVDPGDVPVTKELRKALRKAFVVALEVRESAYTELADVVFPVAPTSDKSGSFVTWEGRLRPFEQVLESPTSLPDVRVLAGIAEERGRPIGVRTPQQAAAEMAQLGPWEGARATASQFGNLGEATSAAAGKLVLASWKQLIDDGRMQDGDDHYRATARRPVVLVNQRTFEGLAASGIEEGDLVTLTGPLGSLKLPVRVADLVDGAVWAPASAPGFSVRHLVGPAGSPVTVEGGSK
jgi:NADH-quinone oxidoreductase subunit G